MKMRYMITFGEHFWKKIDEIIDAMNKGFSPVRVEAVDPHSRASRYIYPFNDMPSGDSFTNIMNLVSILDTIPISVCILWTRRNNKCSA